MTSTDASSLTIQLKDRARSLGFCLQGVCPAVTPPDLPRFHEWLAAGYAGDMHYLPQRAAAYAHPEHVLAGARSLMMLGFPYLTETPAAVGEGQGRVSRYAWGEADYHDVIHQRLKQLVEFFRELVPQASCRGVVDTAPLLEREFAQLAGLGWRAKNTMLINRQWGSWFFLAALLTDQQLEYDLPHRTDHCGTCTACLDACPTDAFPRPYVLDATRCISYLTIELRGPVPPEFREQLADWVFGCDICQEVCPWNRRPLSDVEAAFAPRDDLNPLDLAPLFWLDDEAFRQRFRRTPLWRARRRGLLRSAALVLGAQRNGEAVPALLRGLVDPEPLVRGAAAWALGRYLPHTDIELKLRMQLPNEADPIVRDEIQAALDGG